ncbi:mitochondrial amidoxime reducing component 2 isoform X1 [Meriones unguiculatus]|uniref:mitochondrial amidoxime reducing component 2 isoform X1 n=2 Tax=Meriones unguiculatus TaxID=10047 RepID=UPI000B4ED5D6|nr:mitochondrial amidoxime reducing component 2 isoform X1 [Meriones unguiculatus]
MGASSSSALARLGLPGKPRSTWLGVAALGLAAVALGTVAWRRVRPRRRRRLQQVGTVSKVWIYPIKSCKGVSVCETECTDMGLRCGKVRDRFWMVVKEDGHMVTARQEPRLVLVSITLENNYLTLEAPEMDPVVLPIKLPSSNKIYDCRLFGLDIKGRDCGDEIAQWFTNYLKTQPYRLVQFETSMKGRTTKKLYPSESYLQNYEVAYPDCSPIHMISEASLEDLNTRLKKKVKMEYFRPNIMVSGCEAFEEDTWDELLIGDVEMKKVLSCPRCVLTTVDPDTGIIDRKEPLETLKSYRLCDPSVKNLYQSSPLFGMYFSVEKIGSLRVGDPVYRMLD